MSQLLDKCLADLDRRIDEREEQANLDAWLAFLDDRCEQDIFFAPPRKPKPPKADWPRISVNAAMGDIEAMLLQQFGDCSRTLADGGGSRLAVRCNYGTSIIPSLFGCELFMMEESLNTLPACYPLGSLDRVKAVVDRGVPDLRGGLGARVFDTAERFLQEMRRYPAIGRNVALYHPDTQGPIDIAEVVWGSEIFYAFYDDQDLLASFLEVITQTYAAFLREWYRLVPAANPSVHWALMHRGVLMIRNDSLMNLSPQAYLQFVRPLDQRLFDEFGGGAIHFCGRGDHYIGPMSEMRGLWAINMSQPHLNDMEIIYRNTVDKKIKLIGFPRDHAKKAGRPLRGQVHCW